MPKATPEQTRSHQAKRRAEQPWRRWYGSRQWKRESAAFLSRNPLCRYCLALGRRTPSTIVNHYPPHRGDRTAFFDKRTWEAVCKPCHDSTCQAQDKAGQRLQVTGSDGWPVDVPGGPLPPVARAAGGPGRGLISDKRGKFLS